MKSIKEFCPLYGNACRGLYVKLIKLLIDKKQAEG